MQGRPKDHDSAKVLERQNLTERNYEQEGGVKKDRFKWDESGGNA